MRRLRRATGTDAEAIAELIRASKAAAMPWLAMPHTLDEDKWWARNVLLPHHDVQVAEGETGLLGVIATSPGWIEQLYVAPAAQGLGVGSALLDSATAAYPGELQLWTFARNARARGFYERRGFVAVEFTDGAANEEREPDVRYRLTR